VKADPSVESIEARSARFATTLSIARKARFVSASNEGTERFPAVFLKDN